MTGQLLEQRLDSILSFIETSAKQGVAFTQEQAPDVIQQLLAWNFWFSLLLFLLSLVVLFATVALPLRYRRTEWVWDSYCDMPQPWMMFIFLPLMLGTIGVVENIDWLKILIAPKLYLIEYAASFLQ